MATTTLLRQGLFVCLGVGLGAALQTAIYQAFIIDRKQAKQIAIITKNVYAHEAVVSGVLSGITHDERMNLVPTIYYTDAKNRVTETSVIEKVINAKPDLIVTIGNALSQGAKSIIAKRAPQTPLVFAAVTDPIAIGLVDSLESTGCNVTGAISGSELEYHTVGIRFLLKVLPQVRRIALPYCTESGDYVESIAREIEACGLTRGVEVILMPIEADQSGLFMIQNILGDVDALMYLQNCVISRITDGIVKLCKQYEVVLFAPEPVLVVKGDAPFGFGACIEEIGKDAAKQVSKILIDGIAAANVPVHFSDRNKKFIANLDTIEEQGIMVDHDLLLLISRGIVLTHNQKL